MKRETKRRWAAPAGILLAALLPLLVYAQPTTRSGAVAGDVRDVETGRPVAWTQILLEEANRSTTSAETGAFRLVNIPEGLYTLKAYRIGYEPLIRTVRVPAGDTLRLTLTLTGSPLEAGEVIVESEREAAQQLADAALELEGRRLRQNLGTTIAETLEDEPGIAMRSMGPAPARPVLRGLGGERLLVLEDGGRTGDLSATSTDHAVVIDPLSAERIEVIRGPAALIYGPNTLGGAVNVIRGYVPTSRPDGFSAGYTLQSESVSRGIATGLSATGPAGPVVFHADGSYRRSQDVHTPVGVLENTSLETLSGSAGASLVGRWGHAGVAGSYYTSDYGIPGGFVGAHPNGVDIHLERRHLEARSELLPRTRWVPRVDLSGSYSWYHHEEFESSGALGTEFGLLSYHGEAIAHTRQYGPFRKGAVGVWGEYRDYAAGGLIFTPASTDWTVAGFAFQDVHFDEWTLQAGLRYDLRQVSPREEQVSRVIGRIRARTFGGLSGAVSGLWHPRTDLSLGTTLMRSLRVPGIEELYSEGPHLAAYSFEVGNPNLEMERGWGAEAFLRYDGSRTDGKAAVYRNRFSGYIFPRNTGETNVRTLLPIYQTTGAEAVMYGAEGSGEIFLSTDVSLLGSFSYVHATFTDTDEPIPFIPPLSARLGLEWSPGAWTFGLTAHAAAEQNRVGAHEEPTDGYVTLDSYVQYFFTAGRFLHTIDLGVENVTDAEYRDHLSRVKVIMPEPGRNLKLLYRMYF